MHACYRQAYGQKTEVLNSMLTKELLLLAVHMDRENIKRDKVYFLNAFAEVMEKYNSVLENFIRSTASRYDCLIGLKVIHVILDIYVAVFVKVYFFVDMFFFGFCMYSQ